MARMPDTSPVTMSERSWQAGLVVELLDPVRGVLVHRGVELRILRPGLSPLPPAAITPSRRFVWRALPPGGGLVLLVQPHDAPFLPERVELAAGDAASRKTRILLVPHRGYSFAAGDLVLRGGVMQADRPLAGAAVAVEAGQGVEASPARTDADGQFVLHLRPLPRRQNGAARPAAQPALIVTQGGVARRLPAGNAASAEPIRWEALEPIALPQPAAGGAPGREGTP